MSRICDKARERLRGQRWIQPDAMALAIKVLESIDDEVGNLERYIDHTHDLVRDLTAEYNDSTGAMLMPVSLQPPRLREMDLVMRRLRRLAKEGQKGKA